MRKRNDRSSSVAPRKAGFAKKRALRSASCQTCQHPALNVIEVAVASGAPVLRIARTHGVGRSSLTRHIASCMKAKLAIAAEQNSALMQASDVLQEIVDLYTRGKTLLDEAFASNSKPDAVARVMREQRESLAMIAKLTGAFPRESGPTTNIDNRTQVLVSKLTTDELRTLISGFEGAK